MRPALQRRTPAFARPAHSDSFFENRILRQFQRDLGAKDREHGHVHKDRFRHPSRLDFALRAGSHGDRNAARLRDTGEDFLVPAAMAKLHSSRMAQKVTSLCIDLYGAYGFTKEYSVEKFYRDSKIGTIYEGTTNMQLQTIAKVLLV